MPPYKKRADMESAPTIFCKRKGTVFFTVPYVFLMNFSRHLGQVMEIFPLPLGTLTCW